MIGFIISGHGSFASGINSALALISGKQAYLATVDFVEGMSADAYGNNLDQAILSLADCEKIAIFTDLRGGTPFNQAFIRSQENENILVVSGTNLGMLLASIFDRESSAEVFLEAVRKNGVEAVGIYSLEDSEEEIDEDE